VVLELPQETCLWGKIIVWNRERYTTIRRLLLSASSSNVGGGGFIMLIHSFVSCTTALCVPLLLFKSCDTIHDRLFGLVVRVLDYRSGGPGSIPGTTRFSGKKKKKRKISSGSGTGSTQPREYN
jgi:hypothetical protein